MTISICQDFIINKYYIGLGLDCEKIEIDGAIFYDTEDEVVEILRKIGYTVKKENTLWNPTQREYQTFPVLGWVAKPGLHPSMMPAIYKKNTLVYNSDCEL